MIAHSPPGELAVFYYDSITGGRRHNTDYLHICDAGPALAIAVADGDGDHADAAQVAQITAQIAAAVAASTGNPTQALHAAKHYVDDRNHLLPPGQKAFSTATAVTLSRAGGTSLAWAGNSPVWGVTPEGEVAALTWLSCHPRITPCNVSQRHSGLLPHSRTVDLDRFARLIVATHGLTTSLLHQSLQGGAATMGDQLADLAGIHQDGGYALAQLLDLADSHHGHRSQGSHGNTTIAVIDLLPHRLAEEPIRRSGREAVR